MAIALHCSIRLAAVLEWPMSEINLYAAYFSHVPFGPEGDVIRSATQVMATASAWGQTIESRKLLPKWYQRLPDMTDAEILAACKKWAGVS